MEEMHQGNTESDGSSLQTAVKDGAGSMETGSDLPATSTQQSVDPSLVKLAPEERSVPVQMSGPPSRAHPGPGHKADRMEKLRIKLQKNPWDVDSWNTLLSEAQQRGDDELTRDVFEKLVEQFPTASKYWIAYAEFEQRNRAFERMEAIFGRCLRNVPSVELWKFYLNYVRRTHTVANMPPERKLEARATLLKAYELVLQNVGYDKDAGYIWSDYINFIKSGETSSIYEDQQQMDLLRRAYHRAIWIPLTNIEQIWKDYDAFENGLNKLTAKKFLSEKSAGYMTARTALRELKTLLDPIEKAQKSWMAKPPSWTEKELQILAAWKRYIAWERTNPLRLDDKTLWISRVMYAHKTALLMLRFYPELHYDVSSFLKGVGKTEEAILILKSGVDTLPTSLLLNLSLAELEESRKKDYKDISKIFDTLIAKLETKLEEINTKYDAEREKLMASLQKGDEASAPDDWDGERREREREKQKERQLEVEQKVEDKRKKEIEDIKQALSTVWIVYMRTSRRAQSINAARLIFTRARKSAHCTYHVWVAAGLMEYFCNKDANVAGRVFEIGLKTFNPAEDPQATQFILHYLDFLINLNDDNNTRALFERALSALPAQRAKPIWGKLLAYEIDNGDLANILKAEKRRAEAFPEEQNNSLSALSYVAERWSFLGIDHVGDVELGLSAQRDLEKRLPGLTSATQAARGHTTSTSAQHQNRPEDRSSQRKFQSLESVHPERYPRPDLNKWTAYKPEAAPVKPSQTGAGGDASATASPHISAVGGNVPPPVQLNPDPRGPGLMVPEAVAKLMSVLQPAHMYNGPILPINDIIDLFRQLPLPTPPNPPLMVQIPSAQGGPVVAVGSMPPGERLGFPRAGPPGAPYKQRGFGAGDQRGYGGGRGGGGGSGSDRDASGRDREERDRGGRGRGRGRGARNDGGGGRSGMKRRGGFDDDHGYEGPSHINRPPENDIFRARHQFKRVRENPDGA